MDEQFGAYGGYGNQIGTYYKLSGKVSLLGVLLLGGIGFLSTLLLGLAYGYAIFYIPYIAINVFLALGFGASVGSTIGGAGRRGKIRNRFFMGGAGCFFALVALYFAWAGYISAVVGEFVFFQLLIDPLVMLQIIQEIAQTGVWSLSETQPPAAFYYSVWFIEAISVIMFSSYFAWETNADAIYCEKCQNWVNNQIHLHPFAYIADLSFKGILEGGDMSPLLQLPPTAVGSPQFSRIVINRCHSCQDLYLLTMSNITKSRDSKGSEQTRTNHLIRHMHIDQEWYHKIDKQFKNSQSRTDSHLPTAD